MSKSHWMIEQEGNFSNDGKDTFDPRKRYVGVRLQQGFPLLDRDWNEFDGDTDYMIDRHPKIHEDVSASLNRVNDASEFSN